MYNESWRFMDKSYTETVVGKFIATGYRKTGKTETRERKVSRTMRKH